ncbi:hypothetical protein ACB094_03G073400 [Castanea mollissima]
MLQPFSLGPLVTPRLAENLNITLYPILKERCQRQRVTGEDWSKIFHIPELSCPLMRVSLVESCWSLHSQSLSLVHKFRYKVRFLDDDDENLFAFVRVSKVQNQLDLALQF